MKNAIKILIGWVIIVIVFILVLGYKANKMQEYEKAHNCKYDYNELCYTIEQRPNLFK